MSIRFSNTHGFSLIEIMSLLIMIGVLSSIVLISDITNRTELGKEADIVKTHLRYARYMALSNDLYSWGIEFSTSSYALFKQPGGVITKVILPGESSDTRNLPPEITIDPVTIVFNDKGFVAAADRIVKLSDAAGNSETITVIQNTGFIP